jgi:hypothetical protein
MEWFVLTVFGLVWIGGIALWIVLTQVIGAIIYLVIGRPKLGARPAAVGMPPPPPPSGSDRGPRSGGTRMLR